MSAGKFGFPELDLMLSVQPFKQEGKPQQIKPTMTEQLKPKQPIKKKSIIVKAFDILDLLISGVSGTPNIDHDRVSISGKPLREATEHYLSESEQENRDLEEIEEEWVK